MSSRKYEDSTWLRTKEQIQRETEFPKGYTRKHR
jgi:hypothetical protein